MRKRERKVGPGDDDDGSLAVAARKNGDIAVAERENFRFRKRSRRFRRTAARSAECRAAPPAPLSTAVAGSLRATIGGTGQGSPRREPGIADSCARRRYRSAAACSSATWWRDAGVRPARPRRKPTASRVSRHDNRGRDLPRKPDRRLHSRRPARAASRCRTGNNRRCRREPRSDLRRVGDRRSARGKSSGFSRRQTALPVSSRRTPGGKKICAVAQKRSGTRSKADRNAPTKPGCTIMSLFSSSVCVNRDA